MKCLKLPLLLCVRSVPVMYTTRLTSVTFLSLQLKSTYTVNGNENNLCEQKSPFLLLCEHVQTVMGRALPILQPFRRFTYITTHSPTLPLLYLRHSSFSNPSFASPTSQFILQPFFRFSYVTSSSLNSPGESPMQYNGNPSFSFLGVCEYPKHVVTLSSHYEPIGKKHTCDKITIICHSDFSGTVAVRSCDGNILSHPTPIN